VRFHSRSKLARAGERNSTLNSVGLLPPHVVGHWGSLGQLLPVLWRRSPKGSNVRERRSGRRAEACACGRVFYGQGNDFNNLSSENASALGSLDTILSSLQIIVSHKAEKMQLHKRSQGGTAECTGG
jgi:hypothetical protein